MKTISILFIAFMFAFTGCEKETIDCPVPNEGILGLWSMYHDLDMDGVPSDTWVINGQSYSYDMTIHSLERGEVEVFTGGYHYRTYKFYLTVVEDSLHISYDYWNHNVPPMLPAFGWHHFLHYEIDGQEVLLLGISTMA
jgi:hypothetical protein